MSHRCLAHLFINNPLLCHHVPHNTTHTPCQELSGCSPFHFYNLPHPTSRPCHPLIHNFSADELLCEISSYTSRVGRPWSLQTLHVCKSVWPGVATFVNYGKDMDRCSEGAMWIRKTLLRFEHPRPLPTSPTPHTLLTFPSAHSALIPRRASYAQLDDRVWPKPQRSSTMHHRRRRRSCLSSPILLSTSACSSGCIFKPDDRPLCFHMPFMPRFIPPTPSCDACIAITTIHMLLFTYMTG